MANDIGRIKMAELITSCCKCGSLSISMKWVAHKRPYETHFGEIVEDNEHLKCECGGCGYAWQEKPLDKRKD